MSKNKNQRRIGQGMKPRDIVAKDTAVSADAGQNTFLDTPKTPSKAPLEGAESATPGGGTLESATEQNGENIELTGAELGVAVGVPAEARKNLEDLLRGSYDARSSAEDQATQAQAGTKPTLTIAQIEDAIHEQGSRNVHLDPDGTVRTYPVGERPDGTFGIVVTVREGMIAGIQQQAEADKQAPEDWVSERFGEWLESWWQPPVSR